jgi:hypothetical protein
MTTKEVSTRMSVAEIVVAGLAVAVLMSGLATGVLAKQAPTSQPGPSQSAHLMSVHVHQQN